MTVVTVALCLFVLTLSIEYMLPGLGGLTLSEIATYAGAAAIALIRPFPFRGSYVLLVFCFSFAIFPMMIYGPSSAYAPYLKTFTNFISALIVADCIMLSIHRIRVFRILSLFSLFAAILGIAQAVVGFGIIPDVYQIGGVPKSGSTSIGLMTGESEKLLGVMRWKAALMNQSLGFPLLNGLSYGMHWFSNNFAEYLVFGSLASWITFGFRRNQRFYFLLLQITLFVAIVLSGARTALLGFFLVQFVMLFLVPIFNRLILLLSLCTLCFLVLVVVDPGVFIFDNGATIEGRALLNSAAWQLIGADSFSVLFGGNALDFAASSSSNVHATFLYHWLYGGVLVAVTMSALFAWWMLVSLKRFAKTTLVTDKFIYAASFAAQLWFVVYGLTWAAVTLPNSVIITSLFVSLGTVRKASTIDLDGQ